MPHNLEAWIARILLLSMKIFENRSLCVMYSIMLMSVGVFSTFGSIVGFYNITKTAEKFIAIVSITSQLNGVVLFVIVLICREKLLRLFNKLEKKQEQLGVMLNRTEVFIKNKLIWGFAGVIAGCLVFVVPPIITTAFEYSFDDERSLLIPFWFSCAGKESNGILCQEVPALSRTTIQLMNLYLTFALSVYMFAYILSFTLFGTITGDLEMHMDIIAKKVDRFNKFAEEVEKRKDSRFNDTEEQLYRQFFDIFKYQKYLHGCNADAVDTWKLYASYYFGSCFTDVTLFLYTVIVQSSTHPLSAFRVLNLAGTRLLMALILASYTQHISHLNEDFLSIMSKIQWYNRDRKFCQVYHQVLTLHQTSNLMKLAGIIELNLNYYARLLRNIYSVVNLIYLRYGS